MTSQPSPRSLTEESGLDWHYESSATKRRRRTSPAEESRPSPREVGVMRESKKTGTATFLGSSSGIHFIRHVYSAFARRSTNVQQSQQRGKSSVPGEDDQLQGEGLTLTGERGFWSSREVNPDPTVKFSFDDLVAWTRDFFEIWHPCFPCLHGPTVLKTMEQLAFHSSASINRLDMVVIRSILSISLADNRQRRLESPRRGPVPSDLVFKDVTHVMTESHSLLSEHTTLQTLQAAFAAQLVLVSSLRLNAASRLGGVIIRTAFHLGLHRCPSRFTCFTVDEINLRSRLFWSIYTLDRYLSQALGIPLGIRDDDIDVCFPNAERHDNPDMNVVREPRLVLFSHLARFAQVRGLILELRNKSIYHSNATPAEVSRVNGEIAKWWNQAYDDVYSAEDGADTQVSTPSTLRRCHQLLLEVLRHEAIISMNRPVLAVERPNPEYKLALQVCIASSRSLLLALKNHLSSAFDAPLAWPSYTWITWIACLILMYASWEGEISVTIASKYARTAIQILEHLSLRGSSWPETCIDAIKSMQSNLSANSEAASCRSSKESEGLEFRSDMSRVNQGLSTRDFSPRSEERTPHTFAKKADQAPESRDCRGHQTETVSRPGRYRSVPAYSSFSAQRSLQDLGNLSAPQNRDLHESRIFASEDQTVDSAHGAGQLVGDPIDNSELFATGDFGSSAFAFSDPFSFTMTDAWSVADRPWMVHENLW
ncbi:hypothetical protein N7539_002127 [Penicillium diatomitis]|uniref:Xylanolytic transcriptional activator regulatory domain-containing protein n=1 Tax=Penicillium diatomitis TaxID=2819901 RepID=A0A9W9XI14_9EURO|nr:uncharacterized protein N7539_002127 [Penicillium diatomitis]KAJ5493381.1 hypothetical protein N7539_002127 [Penicillium diatomitis]